jgi:hypothetical protein
VHVILDFLSLGYLVNSNRCYHYTSNCNITNYCSIHNHCIDHTEDKSSLTYIKILSIINHMQHMQNTVVKVVHPTLGYVHNDWILYYSFCNRLRLAHCTYNRDILLSLSPSCLASLQCKPLSLCNISLTFKQQLFPSQPILSLSLQR